MNLTLDQQLAVREHAAQNHAEVMRSNACRCIACLQRFSPEDVVEWVSHRRDGSPVKIGDLPKKRAELTTASAICPMCGNIGVVGDASGFPLNDLELWRQV